MDNLNNQQMFNDYQTSQPQLPQLPPTEKYKWIKILSLVLGIATLCNIFLVGYSSLMAIGGIILAFVYKNYTKKFCFGGWLNIVALILSIVVGIFVTFGFATLMLYDMQESLETIPIEDSYGKTTTLGDFLEELEETLNEENIKSTINKTMSEITETWYLKPFNGGNIGDEYVVICNLNEDETFSWEKYDDRDNNYVKGTYTLKNLYKENNDGAYYSLILTANEFVVDGEIQDEDYVSKYEVVLINYNGKRELLFYNVDTMSMYYGEN